MNVSNRVRKSIRLMPNAEQKEMYDTKEMYAHRIHIEELTECGDDVDRAENSSTPSSHIIYRLQEISDCFDANAHTSICLKKKKKSFCIDREKLC